jgi:hypothetical protein
MLRGVDAKCEVGLNTFALDGGKAPTLEEEPVGLGRQRAAVEHSGIRPSVAMR